VGLRQRHKVSALSVIARQCFVGLLSHCYRLLYFTWSFWIKVFDATVPILSGCFTHGLTWLFVLRNGLCCVWWVCLGGCLFGQLLFLVVLPSVAAKQPCECHPKDDMSKARF